MNVKEKFFNKINVLIATLSGVVFLVLDKKSNIYTKFTDQQKDNFLPLVQCFFLE